MNLTDRERAAVLAGLRMLRGELDDNGEFTTRYVFTDIINAGIEDVLTNGGTLEPLTPKEIDELCYGRLDAAFKPSTAPTSWIVVYHHRHGLDAWPVYAEAEPTLDDVMPDCFEEDREDEWLEILGPYPRGSSEREV